MSFPADLFEWPPAFFAGRTREIATLSRILLNGRFNTASVVGAPGVGKTALVKQFIGRHRLRIRGGVSWVSLDRTPLAGEDDIARITKEVTYGTSRKMRSLVVLDGADAAAPELVGDLIQSILRDSRSVRVLVVSRREVRGVDYAIHLGPLSEEELRGLWGASLLEVGDSDAQRLYQLVKGHPLLGTLVGRLVRDGVFSIDALEQGLSDFTTSGVVDQHGDPIESGTKAESQIIASLRVADEHVLRLLRSRPERLYDLTPRQFEELVAEILQRLGYSVELTPATRDGGKDIYAARQDHLGSFLYVVECKRYAADNPVGVGLVRQLYGTVMAERASAGIMVTTSFFSQDARQFSEDLRYQLSLRDFISVQDWLANVLSMRKKSGLVL